VVTAITSQYDSSELYTQPTYVTLVTVVAVGKVAPIIRYEFVPPVVHVKV
jgi:hypothetical protein